MAGMDSRVAQLLAEAGRRDYSRRELVKRGLALGLSMSAIGGVLAGRGTLAGANQGTRACLVNGPCCC